MKPHEIKDLRKEKKLTQEAFGGLCGVSKAAVSNWENGRDNPSGAALKILKDLQSGDLVVTELTDLEMKLLDQNVAVGKFKCREDYLTASLKYLLVHKKFMPLQPEAKLSLVAEEEEPYQSNILDGNKINEIEANKPTGENGTDPT